MNIKSSIIGATTAFAIAAGSIAFPATASAASPFGAMKTAQIETSATGVEEVKKRRRGKRYGKRYRRGRGINAGTAAAIGVGAVALGILAATAAQSAPRCRVVKRQRWSNRYNGYVTVRQRVC
ncbi:MAG: hypothetical protein AAGJ94_17095 [Pseudomonadota bacterium]